MPRSNDSDWFGSVRHSIQRAVLGAKAKVDSFRGEHQQLQDADPVHSEARPSLESTSSTIKSTKGPRSRTFSAKSAALSLQQNLQRNTISPQHRKRGSIFGSIVRRDSIQSPPQGPEHFDTEEDIGNRRKLSLASVAGSLRLRRNRATTNHTPLPPSPVTPHFVPEERPLPSSPIEVPPPMLSLHLPSDRISATFLISDIGRPSELLQLTDTNTIEAKMPIVFDAQMPERMPTVQWKQRSIFRPGHVREESDDAVFDFGTFGHPAAPDPPTPMPGTNMSLEINPFYGENSQLFKRDIEAAIDGVNKKSTSASTLRMVRSIDALAEAATAQSNETSTLAHSPSLQNSPTRPADLSRNVSPFDQERHVLPEGLPESLGGRIVDPLELRRVLSAATTRSDVSAENEGLQLARQRAKPLAADRSPLDSEVEQTAGDGSASSTASIGSCTPSRPTSSSRGRRTTRSDCDAQDKDLQPRSSNHVAKQENTEAEGLADCLWIIGKSVWTNTIERAHSQVTGSHPSTPCYMIDKAGAPSPGPPISMAFSPNSPQTKPSSDEQVSPTRQGLSNPERKAKPSSRSSCSPRMPGITIPVKKRSPRTHDLKRSSVSKTSTPMVMITDVSGRMDDEQIVAPHAAPENSAEADCSCSTTSNMLKIQCNNALFPSSTPQDDEPNDRVVPNASLALEKRHVSRSSVSDYEPSTADTPGRPGTPLETQDLFYEVDEDDLTMVPHGDSPLLPLTERVAKDIGANKNKSCNDILNTSAVRDSFLRSEYDLKCDDAIDEFITAKRLEFVDKLAVTDWEKAGSNGDETSSMRVNADSASEPKTPTMGSRTEFNLRQAQRNQRYHALHGRGTEPTHSLPAPQPLRAGRFQFSRTDSGEDSELRLPAYSPAFSRGHQIRDSSLPRSDSACCFINHPAHNSDRVYPCSVSKENVQPAEDIILIHRDELRPSQKYRPRGERVDNHTGLLERSMEMFDFLEKREHDFPKEHGFIKHNEFFKEHSCLPDYSNTKDETAGLVHALFADDTPDQQNEREHADGKVSKAKQRCDSKAEHPTPVRANREHTRVRRTDDILRDIRTPVQDQMMTCENRFALLAKMPSEM